MSTVTVRQIHPGSERDHAQWEALWRASPGATLFHHPGFLAYHGTRFEEHHLGVFKGEALIGLMPAAVLRADGHVTAASPYGGSYGGLISPAVMGYSLSASVVSALIAYLRGAGVSRVTVVPSISPYHASSYSETFLFAMLEQGFHIVASEITSVVPLSPALERDVFTSRVRNSARRAEKSGVVCALKAGLDDFWTLMDMTFGKHGTEPTHSYEEWKWLTETLPEQVWVDVAYVNGTPVAGIGHLEISPTTDSSFYLCSDPAYAETQALTLLICRSLLAAQEQGYSWFDFGTSTTDMVARENIFRFKEGFGAVGAFRHRFAADL